MNQDPRTGRFVRGNHAANGSNQYTYRARAQSALDRALKRDSDDGGTILESLVHRILDDALQGNPHAQRLVWQSLIPRLEHQERVAPVEGMTADELHEAFGKLKAERGNGRDLDA